MRLIDTNFCTESVTSLEYSSQKPGFPASNLKNPFKSKRWRSSGSFLIDATNNAIDFQEGGSELTATIPMGRYSVAELASQIKLQLESVGTETYTITWYKSTGLWNISSDAAELDLLLATGSNASTSLLVNSLGFTATDKAGATSYTGTRIALHTDEFVTYDMQTAEELNSVVVLWPRESGVTLTPSAELRIQASATNVWTSPAIDQLLTIDETYGVASHFFEESQEYRYWRIVVIDPENSNLYVEIGHVVIGASLVMDEPENGFKWDTQDLSKSQSNEYGHVYTDEYPLLNTLSIDFAYMDYNSVRTFDDSYRRNGSRKPVIIALDPTERVFDKDHFLIYGLYPSSMGQEQVLYDLFNSSVTITELG